MPELPDITAYLEALEPRVLGQPLASARFQSAFVLRSVSPPTSDVVGKKVVGFRRIGKRIVLEFEGEIFMVIHLMIAGRLRWVDAVEKSNKRPPRKILLATFEFPNGRLYLVESSTRKRASVHWVSGVRELALHDPGGLEIFDCTLKQFTDRLKQTNRTLKRALTNPRFFAGIGNAYSDEILHAARLSPVRLTQSLKDEEVTRLFKATKSTLKKWIANLRSEFKDHFPGPGEITAFREDFAVHGKLGKPCPVCGMPVQRIRYGENETNYCAKCQNEGRLLADRALSRLLKQDWPRTLEALEERRRSTT